MKLLIYGANGYTGQLLVEEAVKQGLKPVLGGRNLQKIAKIGKDYDLECRAAQLNERREMKALLEGIGVVLHAAGPFKYTAQPMLEACLDFGVHYLDITGEIEAFEMAHTLDGAAQAMDLMLLPGVGFDVVPTDCLALFLHRLLPEAEYLQLAFSQKGGGVSHGTAMTMVENLRSSGAVRKDGKIIPVPLGHKTLVAPFPGQDRFCMTIPWGDVSTAFYSTGIPNIETYTGIHPGTYRWFRLQRYVKWLIRSNWVQKLLKKRIDKAPAGPGPEARASAKSMVWGKVSAASGASLQARMLTPGGYTLTAIAGIIIARKVMDGNWYPGFQTPAKAYGPDLIMEIPGVEREVMRNDRWEKA